jgi:hypothetical protein
LWSGAREAVEKGGVEGRGRERAKRLVANISQKKMN